MPNLTRLDTRLERLERKQFEPALYNGHWFEKLLWVCWDNPDGSNTEADYLAFLDTIKCQGCGRTYRELEDSNYSPECEKPGETPPTHYADGRMSINGELHILHVKYTPSMPADKLAAIVQERADFLAEMNEARVARGQAPISKGLPVPPKPKPRPQFPHWYRKRYRKQDLPQLFRYIEDDERFYRQYADPEKIAWYKKAGFAPPVRCSARVHPPREVEDALIQKRGYKAWLAERDIERDEMHPDNFHGEELAGDKPVFFK